ncbi:MAG: NAD(P)H-hydrate dehydratase [Oscillospiraceae bacterium]|nr:NAD(P)H-hydrate dehydratase [Oscillospiraceae bacterium]
MTVYTEEQMKKYESYAAQNGVGEAVLMKNAGVAVADDIIRLLPEKLSKVSVFCGKGKNGGDGFILANRLYEQGFSVSVILCHPENSASSFPLLSLLSPKIPVFFFDSDEAKKIIKTSTAIVDAVFGTGFSGSVSDYFSNVFSAVNDSKAAVISVDLPSGISASGLISGSYVKPDLTFALGALKPAHVLFPAKEYCCKVVLLDIGIPSGFSLDSPPFISQTTEEFVFSIIKKRPRDCHKGNFGRLLNISGSVNYLGAPVFSSVSAMRCGCGIVELAAPDPIIPTVMPQCLGAIALPLPVSGPNKVSKTSTNLILSSLSKSTACLIGCGLGLGDGSKKLVSNVIKSADVPLIIDADGINAICGNINILKERRAPTIITPHLGEMSRLSEIPVKEIRSDKISCALKFASQYACTVVLKDSTTVIASPDGKVFVNPTGNPGLAKGGSGDVLAGIIAGLAAQGIEPFSAAVCGVYLHGLCADKASSELSERGMLPSDLPGKLCEIFKEHDL